MSELERTDETLAKIQSQRDKLQSDLERVKFRWKYQLLYSTGGGMLAFVVTYHFQKPSLTWAFLAPAATIGVLFTFLYPLSFWLERSLLQVQIRTQERYLGYVQKEQLQTSLKEDFFTKLVQLNFRYLDRYYAQTQAQADNAFQLTVVVASVSVVVVLFGVVLMFFAKIEAAIVTAGAGVLSEFIAAVFFYFYNRTIMKMGQYHHKLVITQNIGIAMKIAEQLPEAERVISQKALIDRLTIDVNKYLSELPDPK